MTDFPPDQPALDEIEVEIDPAEIQTANGVVVETPNPDAAAQPAPTAPQAPAKVIDTEEGVEAIKARLAAAESRAAQETAARQQAERTAAQAQTSARKSEIDQVAGAVEQVKQNGAVLEGQLADAMAAQDFATAAKIQRQMAANEARQLALEDGLERLKAAPPAPPPRPDPRTIADPVERTIAQWDMSAPSADFVRKHPSLINKPTSLLAAHNLAVDAGCAVDSPEYFAHAERTLGLAPTDAPRREAEPRPEAATGGRIAQPPAAPPAAPVRDGGGSNGSRQVIRLSADEREMAHAMFVDAKTTPAEAERIYARNKAALQAEGAFNKVN